MKKYLVALFVLVFFQVGCSQTIELNRWATWNPNYNDVFNRSIQPELLEYYIYFSTETDSANYQLLAISMASDSSYDIYINNPELYTGQSYYFYYTPFRTDLSLFGISSGVTGPHEFVDGRVPGKGGLVVFRSFTIGN